MDYRNIGHMHRGAFDPGKLKIQPDGFYFKSGKSGRAFHVSNADLDMVEWMRVARGHEIKIFTKDGSVTKFAGFKESDYPELKEFLKSKFHKDLREVDLSVKGWNWGEARFRGSLLGFYVDNKPAFEIPLKEVSQVTSGKNEVVLEFHQSEDAPLSLVEMRFHIPTTTVSTAGEGGGVEGAEDGGGEEENNPVKIFHEKCLARADVIQATGDTIVTFSEIHSLTPRGRYAVKAYPTFLQLHGKTFDYKIAYDTVTRLFLLPHNDQRQMYFVIGLDPPIRQGQTRYYFVIFLLPTEDEYEVTLSLTEEELREQYEGKLSREMSGLFYEVFSRVMRVLVGKKITVPGTFKSNNNQCAITCSSRAASGYLYPLDKGFIFVHKPAVYIKFDAIASVNFARMTGGAGVSKSFDFEVELKDGNVHHFSSMMKEDYTRLFEFVSEKNLRVKNKGKVPQQKVSYDDDLSSESDHDAYLERMKAEGEERDSEDEDSDFVAKESGTDDELEYDSDAKVSDEDEDEDEEERGGGEGEESQSRKRKKDSSKVARPAKKRKEESSGGGRKKKSKKDPNAPKKPLSAYMLWLQENRESIKRKYPGSTSVADVAKRAGEIWKTLTADDKAQFESEAKRLKVVYQKAMQEYKASGGGAETTSSPAKKSSQSKKKSTASKSPAKKPRADAKESASRSPSKKARTDTKEYKSAQFVKDSDDSSEEEEEPDTKQKTAAAAGRSRRSGGDDNLVSLPSEGESEPEAESSGSEEEEEESESD